MVLVPSFQQVQLPEFNTECLLQKLQLKTFSLPMAEDGSELETLL